MGPLCWPKVLARLPEMGKHRQGDFSYPLFTLGSQIKSFLLNTDEECKTYHLLSIFLQNHHRNLLPTVFHRSWGQKKTKHISIWVLSWASFLHGAVWQRQHKFMTMGTTSHPPPRLLSFHQDLIMSPWYQYPNAGAKTKNYLPLWVCTGFIWTHWW